uniref:Formate/nitrite transporter n=1 Tax=Mantoniella antarctica TaxID=81844 RepID=A0A7S0SUZ3_9CHLO|eukprot:CAMPEP_0181368860 /NCGR_PEP_ID=MMETSP1106-20121128/12386_1 /TAXON_ID=81844 /ORGANISM="Mantoniella antarctica, Strain SL-175" /LENGTH=354 /DNA_ID=CAMNT_0023485151 /DNA_START=86 /DNA_END=1150 /DNA_ORIENTATION=-
MASVLQSLALPSASQLVRATPCRQRQVSVARGVVGSPRVPGSVRFGIVAAPSSWTLGGVLHSGSSRGFRVVPNTASVSFTTAPPSAPSPPPAPAGDALPPPAVFNVACAAAEMRAKQDPSTTLALGFSAGLLIGVGALLMTCVGGASPGLATANPGLSAYLKGAIGLPAGLTLVILTGGELFTGNVFIMLSGLFSKRVSAAALMRNWSLSFVGNFLGCLALAYLAVGANTAAAPAAKAAAMGLAAAKCALPFSVAFIKGILCNWLVCLAIWGTMASTSVAGKILAIFWPISMFVALGFEHSVANMFIIPHGMLCGAKVTVGEMMMNNILPVTLGNILGAAVFASGLMYWSYGRK